MSGTLRDPFFWSSIVGWFLVGGFWQRARHYKRLCGVLGRYDYDRADRMEEDG